MADSVATSFHRCSSNLSIMNDSLYLPYSINRLSRCSKHLNGTCCSTFLSKLTGKKLETIGDVKLITCVKRIDYKVDDILVRKYGILRKNTA
jgi:hypothetical protein